jgi:predicted acetyltransferase
MIIRRLKPAEADQSIRMSEFAFQYQMTDEERRARLTDMNPEDTWIAEEDGEILSKVTVLPLHAHLYGLPVPSGGVSGVATWPEHRRKGIIALMLKHALEDMKEKGQLLSMLYPFSVPFYRRFGYEMFADQETLTLSREQLPLREEHDGHCRRIERDAEILDPIYRVWAEKYNGSLSRSQEWWRKSVFKRKPGSITVYYRHGKARGYIIYEVKEGKMNIEELIWLDADARKGLFTFIRNHDSMAERFSIKTGAHDIFSFLLPDPKVKREVASYFMARIVDCPMLLSLVPFQLQENENIIIHLEDKFCPWNEGTYIIAAAAGPPSRVKFFRSDFEDDKISRQLPKRGLEMDINMLTAIIMGAQNPIRLWEEEKITGDEEAAWILDKALPKRLPFIYDFF